MHHFLSGERPFPGYIRRRPQRRGFLSSCRVCRLPASVFSTLPPLLTLDLIARLHGQFYTITTISGTHAAMGKVDYAPVLRFLP